MSERPTIVIADDHAATRGGVRAALEEGGFDVCAEADDAAGAVEAALRERPDLCLLDIQMPGNGIEAAAEIARGLPGTRVVMLTVSVSDDDLFLALRAGARGYLLKDTDPDRLPLALRGVLNGEAALPRSLVARVLDEFGQPERRSPTPEIDGIKAHLTERERVVLEMLAEGMGTGEIAERLSISPVTVRRHVGEVVGKLRVPDRDAAVRLLKSRQSG